MNRKTKNVVLHCEAELGPDWNRMPRRLVDLVPWVQKYLGLVPEAYRDTAAFDIASFRYSEKDSWLNVQVHYQRPETDDEMKARLEAEEAQKLERQKADRQKLEDLKEKFRDR